MNAAGGEFDQSQKMVTIYGGDENKPVLNVGYHWTQYTRLFIYMQAFFGIAEILPKMASLPYSKKLKQF